MTGSAAAMTNQRLTQCPHCKASFKVSEDQISAANGRVRCGACMNIFDAIAYSISKVESSSAQEETPSSDTPPIDLEDSLLSSHSDDVLFADNPEEDQQETGYSGSSTFDDQLSTSFLDLDNEQTPSDPYTTKFNTISSEINETDNLKEPVDESWTQNILDDMAPDNTQKIEPHISEHSHISDNTPKDKTAQRHTEQQSASPVNNSNDYGSLHFQYQQDTTPKSRHWFISCIFTLLNITLLAALIAQASWFHYEKLAKYPVLASFYQQACEQLSCTLPSLEDITQIQSNNLVVRSHPTSHKALIIDAVVVNEADFGQNFPDIALYFSDINKRTVAQRLIHPEEYLSGELLNWTKMPPKQPVHISLEIIDPGKEAVNYSLKFFPSATTSKPKPLSTNNRSIVNQ